MTGGSGFLGSHVVRQLEDSQVYAPGHSELDLTDRAAVDHFVGSKGVQRVVHAAGFVGGIALNRQYPGRMIVDNLRMGVNVLETCARHGAEVCIVSTVCAYPESAPVPTPESALFEGPSADDTGFYGTAKRTLYMVAEGLARERGLVFTYIIPTNMYGPGDHYEDDRSHVVAALLARMHRAKTQDLPSVTVWGDGTQTRDLIYVEDAARGILACRDPRCRRRAVNLGSGQELSIREIALTIRQIVGYGGELRWDPSRPTGARRRALDSGWLRSELGFAPQVEFADGLARTYESYLKEITGAA